MNNFFKNRSDQLSHGTINNVPGYDTTEKEQLKKSLKNQRGLEYVVCWW